MSHLICSLCPLSLVVNGVENGQFVGVSVAQPVVSVLCRAATPPTLSFWCSGFEPGISGVLEPGLWRHSSFWEGWFSEDRNVLLIRLLWNLEE